MKEKRAWKGGKALSIAVGDARNDENHRRFYGKVKEIHIAKFEIPCSLDTSTVSGLLR